MKKSYITILLLLMVMILGVSAVSAADIDDTSDLALTQDDSTPLEVEDTSEEVQVASDTEVIADSGDGNNFTSLKTLINEASDSLTLNKDYTRVDGDSDIEINKDFTIDGQDTYTIDANNLGGIFKVNTGYTLTLKGVTLINGNSDNGGAVYVDNGATLNSENCKFNQNTAVYYGGAIYSKGTVDVKDSIFKDNNITDRTTLGKSGGAAIANIEGTLTVDNSEFTDNVKDYVIRGTDGQAGDILSGGAIFSCGDTSIANSDFFNNSGTYGGALTVSPITSKKDATITIDNCNFTDNLAYTAGAAYIGDKSNYQYTILNSWFENNVAMGIGSSGFSTAGGAITLMSNSGSGSITKSTFKDNTVKGGAHPFGGAIDMENPGSVNIDECVFEGNEADFAAGAIFIYSGSPTVNIANSNFTNNKAGTFAGAVYAANTVTLTVSNSLFEGNTANNGNAIYNLGALSLSENDFGTDQDVKSTTTVSGTFTDLQNKINNAEGTLDLAYDFSYVASIDGVDYANGVVIANPITINGNGYTISGSDVARLFYVAADADLTLKNATLTNAKADKGAAVYVENAGEFEAYDVNFIENTATYKGGAIYSEGSVNIVGSVFDSNDITFRTKNDDNGGAAVYNYNGALSIVDSNITNNLKDIVIRNGNAGDLLVGVVVTSGETVIRGSYFANNTGSWGGAISSLGYLNTESYTLTVMDSKFEGNNATFGGAIFVESSNLEVDNCTFENNKGLGIGSSGTSNTQGGAIIVHPAQSSVSITDSTFTGNSANVGAAVSLSRVDGDSIIENCTFTDNTASSEGGAIYGYTEGKLTVANSTFSGNTAPWGNAISNDGILVLSNNTISGSSADIANYYGTIESEMNIVILNNETVTFSGEALITAKVTDDNNNIIKDINFVFVVNETEIDAVFNNTSGLYQAIYKNDAAGLYVVNITYNEEKNLVVKTGTLKNIKGTFTDLANIIANADSFTTTVLDGDYAYNEEFDSDLVNGIVIDKEIILDGNGSTISGNGLSRIFNITGGDIILHDTTLRDAVASYGGAVYVDADGEFTGYNINFINNTAVYRGGAIYSEGLVQAYYSVFDSNDITFRTKNDDNGGAAIYNKNGFLAISDSNITNNLKDIVIREGNDGDLLVGVVVTSGNTFITDSYFANNTGSWGGAISSLGYLNPEDYTVTIRDSKFEGNNATFGGAIFVESANLIVENSTFENNKGVGVGSSGTSNTQGGAIIVHPSGSSAKITDSTFIANSANVGGAVSLPGVDGDSLIDNCTFIDNTAGLDGGALYFWTEGAEITVKDSEFVNNTAVYGGAIENEGIGALTVDNCTFTENAASQTGGAIISSGNTSVSNSIFTDNEGLRDTNAIYLYNEGTTLDLSNNTITGENKVQIAVKNEIKINSKVIATFMNNQTIAKEVGDTVVLNATLTDDNGNFIYDADFKFSVNHGIINKIAFDDETGLYTTEYPIDLAGQYVVSTNYELDGIEKYIGILEVPKINVTEFTVLAVDTLEGENATIWITLKSNETGLDAYVTVIVNNEEYSVDVENGEGNITIEGLTHGQYPVVAILDHPNYDYLINSSVFLVKGKAKLNITELTVAEYGDVIEIAINLTDSQGKPLSGIVVVDETINVLVENGVGTFVIDTQPDVGNYTFQAVYDGDNDYFGDLAIFNVTVNTKVIDPNDVVVLITDFNEFGDAIPVKIISPVDGVYTVNINGTAVDVEVVNGTGSAEITPDKPGVYNATVDIASEGYSLETITTNDFAYLVTPEFNVVITGTYPEAEISITGPAGTYRVRIDGMELIEITREESDLPTTKKITHIDAGDYTALVSFETRDEYYGDHKEISFTINKAALDIAEPEVIGDKVVGSPINITFTLPTDIDPSSVSAFMDGTPVPIDEFVINETTGVYTLPLDGFSDAVGHLFTVQVNDPNYKEDAAQVSFLIEKITPTLSIAVPENPVVGSTIKATVTIAGGDATGYILYNNVAYKLEDGKATIDVGISKAGEQTITVEYLGDDKYSNGTGETTFTAAKAPTTITLRDETLNTVVGREVEVVYTIDPMVSKGNVSLWINDVLYSNKEISLSTGSIVISSDQFPTNGTYTVKVQYIGTDDYADSENDTLVIKVEDETVLINVTIPENTTTPVFNITVPSDATGLLLVDIDGKHYYAPVENGAASITVPGLKPGKYTANVTYTGDDFYDNATKTVDITIPENADENTITLPEGATTSNPTFSINLPSDATGYFEVDVDGKKYVVPVENGTAKISVPGLAPGNHKVTVKYSGDSKYNSISKSTTLKLKEPVAKLSENKYIKVVYSGKATYKVRLTLDGKAAAGKYVTINYNGKNYKVKTDSKGYATLKLNTKVKPKKYTVTATYKGVKVTSKVKVKHVIKAKNKKAKKSKKLKIKIKLKKVDGKVLKNKKVKLKFKGKKYTAITNKKGKAKFTIKKKVMKKLKKGKKYKYKVYYGKDKVTKKIKVKK